MPRIYVTTYAKYNEGSSRGEWLDLEEYACKDDFLEACQELHSDEDDPELMFSDYEDIPATFISESYVEDELWAWLDLDEDDRDTVRLYLDEEDAHATIDNILEAYCGQADSEESFAEQLVDELGYLEQMPENLRGYFDYEAFARDIFITDYTFLLDKHGQGHVFRVY